jgi:pyrroloquinoline quinone biosynthesis protein E
MNNLKFPKPSPSQEYQQIIDEGFRLYPQRYENYLKFKKHPRNTNPDFLPIKIDIEPLSRCNFKCDMCIVSSFENQKRAEDLSLENFKKIVDENMGIYEVKIQGLGEPFLHPDFIKMIEYAASRHIWTRSTTNASLLHKNDNYKRIIDANIGELQISIDGCQKKSYETIRVNSKFDVMIENVKMLNKYQNSLGLNKTRMWFLLQDINYNDLFDIPIFAKELGFKRVTVSFDIIGWNSEEWEEKNSKKSQAHSITQEIIDKLLLLAKEIDIELTFWGISSKYTVDNICPWPFERTFVSSDKYVLPCCMISNPKTFNFGLKNKEFITTWSSKEYIEFRKAHIENNIPDICKFCYEGIR